MLCEGAVVHIMSLVHKAMYTHILQTEFGAKCSRTDSKMYLLVVRILNLRFSLTLFPPCGDIEGRILARSTHEGDCCDSRLHLELIIPRYK